MSAAILTRAACLLASDGPFPKSGHPARHFTMSGLIRAVRGELFPEARAEAREDQRARKEHVSDDKKRRIPTARVAGRETNEGAWAWAYALIPQSPMDKSPEPSDLIHAARKLRVWAKEEELIASGLREERRAA
ncbi:MAG: hypothetical protein EON93_26285 [Burkholderiales bacterium]|nr:MAG: hypothetical protein EON93_26285 [Burkholderiales bacterium]